MNTTTIIGTITILLLPLIFAITVHEAAHGWVANKLGDPTAAMQGRVTLNPIKHIDLVGTIILPIIMLILTQFRFMFGWAKPVPVTWENLKHPRRDMALVAIAGPGANFLMALFWAAIAKSALVLHAHYPAISINIYNFFINAGKFGIMINSVLLVLNLIPIPPLDGSRVISALLPPTLAKKYATLEAFGIWIILAVLLFLGRFVLLPPVLALIHLIFRWFGLSP